MKNKKLIVALACILTAPMVFGQKVKQYASDGSYTGTKGNVHTDTVETISTDEEMVTPKEMKRDTIFVNGIRRPIGTDSLDINLTAMVVNDDELMYQVEDFNQLEINVTGESGLVYHEKKFDSPQNKFEMVELKQDEKFYYISAIIDGEETFQIKILEK